MVDIAEFNRSMILHLTQRIDGIEKKIDSQENRSRKLKKEIEEERRKIDVLVGRYNSQFNADEIFEI